MAADHVDALVIFGATRDLAKMETFPALVGLVERGLAPLPRNNERPFRVWPESAVSCHACSSCLLVPLSHLVQGPGGIAPSG